MDYTQIIEDLGREKVLEMYQRMIEIRIFEEKIRYLFLEGKMPGTVHQYIGQEACAVGVMAALKENDVIHQTGEAVGLVGDDVQCFLLLFVESTHLSILQQFHVALDEG